MAKFAQKWHVRWAFEDWTGRDRDTTRVWNSVAYFAPFTSQRSLTNSSGRTAFTLSHIKSSSFSSVILKRVQCLYTPWKHVGVYRYSSTHSYRRHSMEVGGHPHTPAALTLWYSFGKRLGGPQSPSGNFEDFSWSSRDSNPGLPDPWHSLLIIHYKPAKYTFPKLIF